MCDIDKLIAEAKAMIAENERIIAESKKITGACFE